MYDHLSYLSFNGNNMGIWNSIYSIMSFYRNLLSHSVVISQCVLKIPEEAYFGKNAVCPKALKDSGIRENALLHPDTQNKKRKLRYDSELMHR